MNDMHILWAVAFLLTLVLEVPIVAVALRRSRRTLVAGRAWARWGAAIVPSTVTHPLLWWVWYPAFARVRSCWEQDDEGGAFAMVGGCEAAAWFGGESLVIAVEAAILVALGLRPGPAFVVSAGVNLFSATLGSVLLAGLP